AAAVSIKHLARKDSAVLTVIGAGQLGQQCIRAAVAAHSFTRVLVCDVNESFARTVAAEAMDELGIAVNCETLETAVRQADVIVTATNSRQPIVRSEWVREGTHLACMGTDLHEKIECEMALLP